MIERLLRWRFYPAVLRWPGLAVTAGIVVLAFSRPRHSEMNVGAALVWQLWWALLPFFVILFARAWCAVCPFPAAGDLLRRAVHTPHKMSSRTVRRLGPWIAVALLGLFGVTFLLLALESNGPLTGSLLLAFAAAAVCAALLWRGLVWCRYACPVGLLLGLYSRLSCLRLEVRGATREAASAGARVCPAFSSPASSRRMHDCTLCSTCLKAPGGEETKVRFGRTAFSNQRLTVAEATGVSVLMGLLLSDALRMVPWYLRYVSAVVSGLRWSYEAAVAAGIVGAVAFVLLFHGALALIARNGAFWERYSSIGLSLLPLVLAIQLSLSAQHLLALGEVVRNVGSEMGLLAPGHMPPADAYVVVWPAKLLQLALVGVGILMALRISADGTGGWRRVETGLVAALATGLLAVFIQPMSVTC